MNYDWVKIISLTQNGLGNTTYHDYMTRLNRGEIGRFIYTKNISDNKTNGLIYFVDSNERKACFVGQCKAQEAVSRDDGTVEIVIQNLVELKKPCTNKEMGYHGQIKRCDIEHDPDLFNKLVEEYKKGVFLNMADQYTLLFSNKQLIMNGAPGTGKTFSARNEIADQLFDIENKEDEEKKKIKNIQLDMVQFHPSYDYTDFIEGIRPNMSNDSAVTYTLKNGIFKKFCRRAGVIERIIAARKEVSVETIKEFLDGEDDNIKEFWIEYFETNKENFEGDKPQETELVSTLPPFLFIIDEINRAEISKVLGETMFCLDADYRGEKGRIATQYSSMATKESFFIDVKNDKFFIPSNVYIIGTMNDIDRSVEVFDFALRRRFAWYEVEAETVMDNVLRTMGIRDALGDGDYSDYIEKIQELNNSIDSLLKLNKHYHLGPSYFAKIKLYLDGNNYTSAREKVWNNHISQILNEYVKGKKTESKIKEIEDAFKK